MILLIEFQGDNILLQYGTHHPTAPDSHSVQYLFVLPWSMCRLLKAEIIKLI